MLATFLSVMLFVLIIVIVVTGIVMLLPVNEGWDAANAKWQQRNKETNTYESY